MSHPYSELEGSDLWRAMDEELAALEANGDLQLMTAREYVIGSLCKRLSDDRLTKPRQDDVPAV